jgi:hypothetical protein
VTLNVFGLNSYMPFLAEVMALHLLALAGAYVLIQRRTGSYVATAFATLLLLLGSGSENLFWAFQTGFVGSVMFGVWALVAVEAAGARRVPGASLLLLGSLMSSGIGLVFLVVFAVRVVLDRGLRSCVSAVAVPAVAYLMWYLAFGREAASPGGLRSPARVLQFVIRGLGYGAGEITGLGFSVDGRVLALVLLVALAVATGRAVVAGRPRALATGSLIGLVTLYVLIGLVRDSMDSATRSRYTYVAGFLVILAVADWVPHLRGGLRSTPQRGVAVAISAFALVLALTYNLRAFQDVRGEYERRADATRAYIAYALGHQGAPPSGNYPPGVMPPVSPLRAALARYGCTLDACGALSGDGRLRSARGTKWGVTGSTNAHDDVEELNAVGMPEVLGQSVVGEVPRSAASGQASHVRLRWLGCGEQIGCSSPTSTLRSLRG